MAEQTINYGLTKPEEDDFYAVSVQNENMETIDGELKRVDDLCAQKENLIKDAEEKNALEDADTIPLSDEAAAKKSKKITFSNIKQSLTTYFDTQYNKYIHPTTAGNRHIPSGGAAGQILRWSADGAAQWDADNAENVQFNNAGTGLAATNVQDAVGEVNAQLSVVLAPYDSGRTYPINSLVMSDGAIYKSLRDDNAGHGVAEAEWWEQYGGMAVPEPVPDPDQIINYTMLYNQGDECGEVTGGWDASAYNTSGHNIPGTKTINRFDFVGASGVQSLATRNKISLSGHKRLISIGKASAVNTGLYVYSQTPIVSNYNKFQNTSIAENMEVLHSIDLSDCQDDYYLGFVDGASAAHKNSIYHLFLLKPDDPTCLLTAAGITTAYTDPETFAENASVRTAILSNARAVKIMTLTCTGDLMYAILNNADWITAIKGNEPARQIIMSNSHWAKFIQIIPAAQSLLNYTMLYDQGDERVNLWSAVGSYGNGVVEKEANCVKISCGSSNANTVLIPKDVEYNLRDYARLLAIGKIVVAQNDSHDYLKLAVSSLPTKYVSNSDQLGMTTYKEIKCYEKANKQVITLDISDITNNGVPYIHTYYVKSGYWYNLMLLRSDPYQSWLTAAGITKSFASLDAVFSDEATLAILMSNREAIQYMLSCTGTLLVAVCQSETASSALVNSPVAYDAAFENAHWRKFMLMCPVSLAAMKTAPDTESIPLMTSNTRPSGMASSSTAHRERQPYHTFDKDVDTRWSSAYPYTAGDYVQYAFPYAIRPFTCCVGLSERGWKYEIKGSLDGITFIALAQNSHEEISGDAPYKEYDHIINGGTPYKFFRLEFLCWQDITGNPIVVNEFNVWGKAVS